jgi:hypothetical protein
MLTTSETWAALMNERTRFERELSDLGLQEYQVAAVVGPATLGFEFDVHYGVIDEVVTDAGTAMPGNGDLVTHHTEASDGFRVKRDGPRLEIATKPFTVDGSGKADMDKAITNILKFAGELKNGCSRASQKALAVPGVSGNPRPFKHPQTVISDLPLVRLPFNKKFHPTNCSVWASPQATITIPLSRVAALVREIKKSEGKGPGVALTGNNRHRMGLRSEAIYRASLEVDKAWKAIVSRNPKIILSDGTAVTRDTFSGSLRGLLILLASYLWTGELPYHFAEPKPRDYEPFAKAYLPINVKAPFSEIYKTLLTPTEQLLFKEVFTGASRDQFFRLARPGATIAAGSTKLFPPGRIERGEDSVHRRQKSEFGSVPTWDDLLKHTLDATHKGWGDRLLVPLSKPLLVSRTKPRVALELRRVGFNAVFAHQWKAFMNQGFKMSKKLNA